MRVKTGIVRRKRHKKILAQTKGFRLSRGKIVKKAKEALLHAGQHAYNDRKIKKRVFRSLWIERLSGALSSLGINYSKFIAGLKKERSYPKLLFLILEPLPKLWNSQDPPHEALAKWERQRPKNESFRTSSLGFCAFTAFIWLFGIPHWAWYFIHYPQAF